MEFRAALLARSGGPLVVESVRLLGLRETDVLVRMEAAGLCHTDLEAQQGGFATVLPAILGHEGAGIVEEVGRAVRSVRPGDKVVCSPIPACGSCFYCCRDRPMLCEPVMAGHRAGRLPDGQPRLHWAGQDVAQFLCVSSFAQYAVIPERGAVPIPQEMPSDRACLLGCALITGAGAVLHVAPVQPGENVCVVGCGPVGLSVIQGARMAGAGQIIALDPDPARRALAVRFGASHVSEGDEEALLDEVRSLTDGRGADHVFETAGSPSALRTALEVTRPGGSTTLLGKLPPQDLASVRYGSLMGDKTIRRSSLGGARVREDIPVFAQAYLDGKLMLDEMITERIALQDVGAGLESVRARSTIRTVIDRFE